MKSGKSPVAIALLAKLKKDDKPMAEESEDTEESPVSGDEAKADAVRGLFKALKRDDVEAGIEALQAFHDACYSDD